jgi:hypothetical protein
LPSLPIQNSLAAAPEAAGLALLLLLLDFHDERDERGERRRVEGLRARVVADADAEVVDDHAGRVIRDVVLGNRVCLLVRRHRR